MSCTCSYISELLRSDPRSFIFEQNYLSYPAKLLGMLINFTEIPAGMEKSNNFSSFYSAFDGYLNLNQTQLVSKENLA